MAEVSGDLSNQLGTLDEKVRPLLSQVYGGRLVWLAV